ncbi:Serine/threonine-protein phosphatase 7 long form [Glycine max]|nr:Serine/threonine-protein phosphatase 7 long form [Glycine max]
MLFPHFPHLQQTPPFSSSFLLPVAIVFDMASSSSFSSSFDVSGLYTTIKLCRIKINGGIINAFVERWRPETYTFHLTCGEATITLQDVSVLLGLPMDDNPLIGNTNIDGTDMCEQYLGVRPNANALVDGNTLKLSWLASEFANIQDYVDDEEHLKMLARAWILRFIGGVLLVDKSSKKVHMRYLQLP